MNLQGNPRIIEQLPSYSFMSFIAEVTNISNFSVMALISGHWAFSENAQISTLILNNAITESLDSMPVIVVRVRCRHTDN